MNKNVIFVYGESYARHELLQDFYKKEDGNIYLIIDDLNNVLGLSPQALPMKFFHSFMKSNCLVKNIDYCSSILSKFNSRGLRGHQEVAKYLLSSWTNFLSKNIDKLSIYRRLDNQLENSGLERSSKEISRRFVCELLNKNAPYHYSCRKGADNKEKYNKLKFDDEKMNELIGFMEENKDTDSKEYRKSDLKLLSKLELIEHKAREGKAEYDDFNKFDLLSYSLINGKLRKLSKLSLEWIKEESEKPDSPIKGWIFLMDYLSDSIPLSTQEELMTGKIKKEGRERIDKEIDWPKRWKEQQTFSNGALYSPITDSEYRHVRRKFPHETGTDELSPSSEERKSKIKSKMFNVEFYPKSLLKREK